MGNINIYDVFVDVCSSGARQRSVAAAVAVAASASATPLTEGSNNNAGCALTYDPCADGKTQTYLNRADVKAAIHANASITWVDCSEVVDYSRFDLLTSMIPTYQYLLSAFPQGRYLVYSGDVDAIVPTTGTRLWLELLGLPEAAAGAWRPYTVGGQVGGWTVDYTGLTFATVRNAGHFVPSLQQERSLYLFTHFLAGTPL